MASVSTLLRTASSLSAKSTETSLPKSLLEISKVKMSLLDVFFTKLKVLRGGNILAVEAETNDSVIFDAKLKETRRIKGHASPSSNLATVKAMARMAQSDFTTETEHVLWMSGPNRLSLLNVVTFDVIELPSFWETSQPGEEATGVVTVVSHKLLRAAGIGIVGNGQTLHVWDATQLPAKRGSMKSTDLFKSNFY